MRIRLFVVCTALTISLGAAQAEKQPASSPAPKSEPAPKVRETTLSFSQAGERWWWAEDKAGKPFGAPQKISDTSAIVKLPENAQTLWVYDAKTGNLAQLEVASLKEKTELTSDRWTHVARVQVNLVAQGKPVASALVTLKDAKGNEQTRVLEPSAEGVVVFERVPLGKVEVIARYGDDQKASQEIVLERERELRVPVIELTLSGTVATIEPRTGTAREVASEEAPPASRIGATVMFVVALVLAVGLIVLLVRLAAQKPQQLEQAMSKLGVELPQAATTGTAATPAAAPSPDLPPLETAGVPPTASTAAMGAAPATRLVVVQGPHAGQVFDLSSDLMTIGREPIHPIALTNDMSVSRRHAQIIRQGDQILIEDLSSTNGTYVNGVRITAPTPLKAGDTIQMGNTILRAE
ncbi:MAG: FHA domain-containing protein [Fimbriimonadales bacterium]|nr:FHA domain-containing protein [Fimbriimonadales bacterium]MDW8051600.1 FHA domain-containing protein [Armatimonadota bacterium]